MHQTRFLTHSSGMSSFGGASTSDHRTYVAIPRGVILPDPADRPPASRHKFHPASRPTQYSDPTTRPDAPLKPQAWRLWRLAKESGSPGRRLTHPSDFGSARRPPGRPGRRPGGFPGGRVERATPTRQLLIDK
jgi:hypothetical protein